MSNFIMTFIDGNCLLSKI